MGEGVIRDQQAAGEIVPKLLWSFSTKNNQFELHFHVGRYWQETGVDNV
jgi:hypothetical protein